MMAGGRTASGAEPARVGTAGTTAAAAVGCETGQADVAGVTEDMVKPTGAVAEPTRVAGGTVRPTGAVAEPARAAVGVTEGITGAVGCETGQADVAEVTEDKVRPTGAVAEQTRVAGDTVRPTGAVTEPARAAVGVTEGITSTGAAVSVRAEPARVMTAGGVAEPAMEVLCVRAGPV